ncbi:MAG: hypothetical protein GY869_09760 [Planctomycetes bacterium]|nr:hypothetical protein [Planctomycetota bacterium]
MVGINNSRLIFLVLILSIAINSSQAAPPGADAPWAGLGTTDIPYQITNKTDLLALTAGTDYYGEVFILTTDIDLTGEPLTKAIIAPDGATPFTGIFNGKDHVIRNLTINTNGAANDYLGLFGMLGEFSEIRNLGLENIAITGGNGSDYIGGLTGMNQGGEIYECYTTGTLSSGLSAQNLGGLVGYNYGGGIIDCYSRVNVSGGDGAQFLGGMIGYNNGAVTKCYAAGIVTGTGTAGGFAGDGFMSYLFIQNCYFLLGAGHNNLIASPLTHEAMQNQNNFILWDFFAEATNGTAEIWQMDGYPVLGWQKPVGLREFALLGQFWMTTDCTVEPLCPAADWFIDNAINLKDLHQLTSSWCQSRIQTDYQKIEDGFETADFTALPWIHGGNASWEIDPNYYQGSYSARSGAIGDGESSSLELTIDTTDIEELLFYYKTSTDPGDLLIFTENGTQKLPAVGGENDWTRMTLSPIYDGVRTYKWTYTKNSSTSAGSDCVWIDNVIFVREEN